MSLPRGLRTAFIDCSHCSGFTAFLKNSAASFQLAAYCSASIVASHFSAAETAAELFKNGISMEQWKQSLNAARRPLGKVTKRTVKSKQYTTSLPGAPDGQYVVIQYETSFENKKAAIETVTPMMDRDGKWRVSGYYIK